MVLMLLTLAACGVNAQNDDMYFVPKKKSVKQATPRYEDDRQPAYYVGSSRDVDEYNRHSRLHSSYQVIEHNDSVGNDIISFDGAGEGYPDTVSSDSLTVMKSRRHRASRDKYDDDYALCRRMQMFDGFYDPWLYGYVGYYDPFYAPYWTVGWGGLYGYYDPWFYGYYDPWFYGYRSAWRYGWGGYWGGYWGNPYYYSYWNGWGWPGYVAGPAVAVRRGHTGTLGYYDRSNYAGTTRRSDRDYRRGIAVNNRRSYGVGRTYGNSNSQMTVGTRRHDTSTFNNSGFQQSAPSATFGSGSRGSFGGGSFGGGSFGGGSRGGSVGGGGMRGGRR